MFRVFTNRVCVLSHMFVWKIPTEDRKDNGYSKYALGGLGLLVTVGLGWYFYNANKQKRTKFASKLLLCGAPGSGKGTQCEKLVKKYPYVHLSTGDMLRAEKKAGTDLGKEASKYMDNGQLVPDDLVIKMVAGKMDELKEKGWILDGFPRTQAQAKALSSAGCEPDKVIVLDVPDETLVERITGRRSDPETNKIYHIKFNPPPEDIAPRVIQRSDDTVEKLTTRLVQYHENVDFVLAWYKDHVPISRLDGMRKPDDVFADIEKIIHS